jgi:hypothetical protein
MRYTGLRRPRFCKHSTFPRDIILEPPVILSFPVKGETLALKAHKMLYRIEFCTLSNVFPLSQTVQRVYFSPRALAGRYGAEGRDDSARLTRMRHRLTLQMSALLVALIPSGGGDLLAQTTS